MQSVSPELEAAQKSASSVPYVYAEFSDWWGDVPRRRFTRYYTGAEADGFGAVHLAGDGSLIRVRKDGSNVLHRQRVTSPGSGSTYSSWTAVATIGSLSGVALAGSGANVWLFYFDTDNRTLKVRESTDNGATFGAAATVATAAVDANYVAAAVVSSGDRLVIWAEGADVYRSRYTGGAWGSRTVWTNAVESISGLAVACMPVGGDFNVVVTGVTPTSLAPAVFTCLFGNGVEELANTWSALVSLFDASAESEVTYLSPSLAMTAGNFRMFFVEKFAGDAAYNRVYWATTTTAESVNQLAWRDAAAFEFESDYGVAVTASGDYAWLSSPAGVWRGSALADLDVSADVLEASVEIGENGSRVRLVLRNDDGRYSGYGAGDVAIVQRGARLDLEPGYVTENGGEVSLGPAFWVERVELVSGPAPRLVVYARDGWWLLELWRARRQLVWGPTGTSVAGVVSRVAAYAGLFFAMSEDDPAFYTLEHGLTIQPGGDGASAVRRLLAMVEDAGRFSGISLLTVHPEAGDAVDYELGTDHAILEGVYRDVGPEVNRVRVAAGGPPFDADTYFGEAFDFAEVVRTTDLVALVRDANLITSADAEARAAAVLRKATMAARRDTVRVFGVVCGLELYDVVAVTDELAGLDAAPRRVLGIGWDFRSAEVAGQPRFDMTLQLGAR